MGEDEHRPGGWMKLLVITAFALLSAAAARARADHFTVYKPWGNGGRWLAIGICAESQAGSL